MSERQKMIDSLNNPIALFALHARKKIVSYQEVADSLQISLADVEKKLVEAILNQDLFGIIDAESKTLKIMGTPPNLRTEPLIKQAQADLQYFDELLSDTHSQTAFSNSGSQSPLLSQFAQPRKRTHSALLF